MAVATEKQLHLVDGDVLLPGQPDYDEARSLWNAMIERHPDLVARCRSTGDVVAAVRYAGEHGLGISIRAGGHNVAGHAVCDGGLMIDLSPMRTVEVDPKKRIARVGGGAVWADVDEATQFLLGEPPIRR